MEEADEHDAGEGDVVESLEMLTNDTNLFAAQLNLASIHQQEAFPGSSSTTLQVEACSDPGSPCYVRDGGCDPRLPEAHICSETPASNTIERDCTV